MTFEEPTDSGTLWTPRLLIAAAVLVGLVLFGLVAILTRSAPPAHSASGAVPRSSATTDPAARPADSAGSAAPPPVSSDGGSGSCNVPPGSQAIPQSAPTDVTWQLYNTIALPYSAQAGPTVIDGDVARCYAHSPEGALLAATQIAVRYALASNWQAVLAEQVMPGTGADVYAAERPGTLNIQGGEFGQYAGFQFVAYTSELAVIEVVIKLPSGEMQTSTLTVQWSGGDWRLQLQPDGSPGPNIQQIPSLAGFIPWAGV
jgi:hypothetical protein